MTLIDTDWNAEWGRLHGDRFAAHDAAFWDRRAREPAADAREASPYASAFIERMRLLPGESVLDVGSGSGTLALPLARRGHSVTAVDFSRGMLAVLRERVAREGLEKLTAVAVSWEDDWAAAGVRPADVAVASRSIVVADLGAALGKLDSFARRRVCVTVASDGIYGHDRLAHEAVGREVRRVYDYEYGLNILFQMGIRPEVSYLRDERETLYGSLEEARRSLRERVLPVDEREEASLERFLQAHLAETVDARGNRAWKEDRGFATTWAFISWGKAEA